MRLNFDSKRLLVEKVVKKNVCYEKDGGIFFKAFLVFSASIANTYIRIITFRELHDLLV